jgi:RimJ/RimL family protein N-acetyltransferase
MRRIYKQFTGGERETSAKLDAMTADSGPSALAIRMARLNSHDPEAYARHLVEHMAESGRGGSPHFALSRVFSREEVEAAFRERLARDLDVPNWGRAWLLWEGERRVVGHLELRGGRLQAEMHRATLGMGLLRAYTAKGHGGRLVQAAIAWSRERAGLRWLDLGVFSNNAPARKLYARMGFVEVGLRADAFRLDAGPIIDDVHMALPLR